MRVTKTYTLKDPKTNLYLSWNWDTDEGMWVDRPEEFCEGHVEHIATQIVSPLILTTIIHPEI